MIIAPVLKYGFGNWKVDRYNRRKISKEKCRYTHETKYTDPK